MFTLSATGPVPVPTPAPLVITSPGTYSVAADGYDGNATPIEIRSSNVVLDGGNHTVDGSGRPGSCGIRIAGAGTLSNVVVRNIRLTNWETGIRAENRHRLRDRGVDGLPQPAGASSWTARAGRPGPEQHGSPPTTITGIVVQDSANTTVHANDVRRTGDGFEHPPLYDRWTSPPSPSWSPARPAPTISGNDLGGEYGSLDLAGVDVRPA